MATGHLPRNVVVILDILDDRGPLRLAALSEILASRSIIMSEKQLARLPERFAEHLCMEANGLIRGVVSSSTGPDESTGPTGDSRRGHDPTATQPLGPVDRKSVV